MEMPITHGFTPDRHLKRYDVAIYKKPGDYRTEKLCLVHGIEATENQALKISVAWYIKRYQFQFIHQHQTCLSAIIIKQITIDSFMLTKTPGIIIDNDATGSFDRVICGLALIALRRICFTTSVIRMLGNTWNKRKCFIKTGFGVSRRSYQSTDDKPTFDLGQGSTAASDIWCIIHGILIVESQHS
jgi:hypothetical protein